MIRRPPRSGLEQRQSPHDTQRARPLAELPAPRWAAVQGIFTDIDDTLTKNGAIEPAALEIGRAHV